MPRAPSLTPAAKSETRKTEQEIVDLVVDHYLNWRQYGGAFPPPKFTTRLLDLAAKLHKLYGGRQ